MNRTLFVILALATLTPACAQEEAIRIQCELSIPKSLSGAQPAQLVFALTNTGRDTLQILNWQTPFEGIKAPMFTIKRDGAEVEYRGRMLKRAAPRKEHYVELKAGERREATIDLTEGWDVEPRGKYTVEYAAQLFDVIDDASAPPRVLDDFKAVALTCNQVAFTRER